MIRQRVIVSRYSEAFIKYTKASIGTPKALSDLKTIKEIIRKNRVFKDFLENPQIGLNDKCSVINEVLGPDISQEARHLLRLLLENNRINLVLDIIEYSRVKYSHEGEEAAILKTAFPLDLPVIEKIKKRLENKLKKKLRFYIDLDASLLGGVQVIIGNKIIDGSIRRRLDDLKEKLMAIQVS